MWWQGSNRRKEEERRFHVQPLFQLKPLRKAVIRIIRALPDGVIVDDFNIVQHCQCHPKRQLILVGQAPTKWKEFAMFPKNNAQKPSEKASVKTDDRKAMPRFQLLIPNRVNLMQETITAERVGEPREP